ncbi:hypothetical protein PCL_09590 [Purpureocillium lilacinum]|uniref:Azaphilone pigments biosynthesis cluster protein L N-terminal domain-containing protein n=1 Tax=Purpureocillium lilacinum TaxID=33203 RepID=A0A2U3DQI9_PURLI|nr:hypothetical protein PCL_09590 [Purpureocillium lilacinum]
MAAPPGASDIVGIIRAALHSSKGLLQFIDSLQSAPDDVAAISADLKGLHEVLGSLAGMENEMAGHGLLFDVLRRPLENCVDVFDKFTRTLRRYTVTARDGLEKFVAWKSIAWVLKDKEIQLLRDTLATYKATLSIAVGTITASSTARIDERTKRMEANFKTEMHGIQSRIRALDMDRIELDSISGRKGSEWYGTDTGFALDRFLDYAGSLCDSPPSSFPGSPVVSPSDTALRRIPFAAGDAFQAATAAGEYAVVSRTTGTISQSFFLLSIDAAIRNQHSEALEELLTHSRACLDESLTHGAAQTALLRSCMTGDDSIATVALNHFDLHEGYFSHDSVASVFDNLKERRRGNVGVSDMKDLAIILEGFRIEHWTPFMIASAFGNFQIIAILKNCTGPKPTPSEIEFALWTASNNRDIKTMRAILEISNGILDQNTIMAMACFQGNKDLVQLLLDNGANINIDLEGSTALGIAMS